MKLSWMPIIDLFHLRSLHSLVISDDVKGLIAYLCTPIRTPHSLNQNHWIISSRIVYLSDVLVQFAGATAVISSSYLTKALENKLQKASNSLCSLSNVGDAFVYMILKYERLTCFGIQVSRINQSAYVYVG